MSEDDNFWNSYTKQLETKYGEAMTLLWRQFDVDEMESVVIEARKEKRR
jgi:hypothetical protein